MRVCEDGAFRDRGFVASGETELEPVVDSLSDGVTVSAGDLAVLVITDDLAELALCLGLGFPASAFDDALTLGCVADRQGRDPTSDGRCPRIARGTPLSRRGVRKVPIWIRAVLVPDGPGPGCSAEPR